MRRKPRRCRGFQRGGPMPSFWKSLFKTSFSRADQLTQSLRIQTWWATHRLMRYQFARLLCLVSENTRRECMTWQAVMGGNVIWRQCQRWELRREPWQEGIYAIGLMACGTTGYLHHVLVTVNGATTNFIMNMMKRTGSTSVKPCNRIESEFSHVWYAMLTIVQYVTMIFTVKTCLHTPE